jgi:hypothetical protein
MISIKQNIRMKFHGDHGYADYFIITSKNQTTHNFYKQINERYISIMTSQFLNMYREISNNIYGIITQLFILNLQQPINHLFLDH